jgi:Protein of unknown function (DUF3568)
MVRRIGGVGLIVAVALAGQGCAATGFPLTVNGTGGAPAQSVNFTLDGIAYRTFSAPLEHLRRATLTTFKRMAITVKSDEVKDDGCRALVATAGDRVVHVELEQITARTTRMRITAKHTWAWRDRATAGEIIVQTERTLGGMPAVSQRTK